MRLTECLTADHAALLVVDMQEKLLAVTPERPRLEWNCLRLIRGAKLLSIPVWATEQNPRGLGPTAAAIATEVPERPAKMTFRCGTAPGLLDDLRGTEVRHVTLVGIEAHVCVAQTALELMDRGLRIQIAADAVGSRHDADRKFSLRRLENAGAVVSTTEAILFEWCETADRPEFKALSAVVREPAPRHD